MFFSNLTNLKKIRVKYGFSHVKNCRVTEVKKSVVVFFKRLTCYLAIAPSLQTFFTTSSTLSECLLQKIKFLAKREVCFLKRKHGQVLCDSKITLDIEGF